jgi:heme exporter protein B
VGIAASGTILSAMAVCTRGREILLPLTLFPLLLPVVAGSVFLMRMQLLEAGFAWSNFWFLLLVGFDASALVISWALFEFVLRE